MTDVDTASSARPPAPNVRLESEELNPAFVAAIAAAVSRSDGDGLAQLIQDLHEADVGALIEALEPDDRPRFILLLGSRFDFTALTEVDDAVREAVLAELPQDAIVEGVAELPIDDAVYILEDLDSDEKDEILDRLPSPERVALQRSLDFPEESAGRRMQTDFVAVPPFWGVDQTQRYLRETADLPEAFSELFVVDPRYRLVGSVPLDKLLRASRNTRIGELASEDRHRVRATDDQEDVARLLQRYNMLSVPVVDDGDRLVGVMTVDDVVDVIQDEADEDLKALGGVRGEEELSDSVWYITRSRFSWLFVNLVTAFVAASVLDVFKGQLQQMVALAVLAPIVASQGGNAATQTMTVAVRALATRELTRSNALRVVWREVRVGMLNGFGFAVLTGAIASLWFDSIGLGLVIGCAMVINMLAGALGGILIPLVLDRYRADPAVSSGVFVTTVTDVVGFFAFLGIATLWFGLS
ncbi:magnesium transporter [Chelatococcus reniformis]|uniref:Magnesium transporter MgtE n=1 Tax=Chelatococcus reniformis TaxID=1494448 RepID=A0A916U2M6_9HYPH|nr:magnesium transporter [Chelatococcus reniformis]GGC57740.1 magnesium transporter MgtE [Chelatococcus reniformis]